MKNSLYQHALDQVAIRYARHIRASQSDISAVELAALVEKNWPKIVAEALSVYRQALDIPDQPSFDFLESVA
jgi:hypothetical protein